MAHYYQTANAHLSHRRTVIHTTVALGFVLLLAIASGFAYSIHDKRQQASAQAGQRPLTPIAQPAVLPDDAAAHPKLPKAETMERQNSPNTTAPGATATSNTSTTITVNGQTTTLEGAGQVDRSYTSEDGLTKVHVAIKNVLKSLRKDGSVGP